MYREPVKIEKGRRAVVKVDISVVGGESLEKSTVEYIQGAGTMLPGLEQVLEGLDKGATREGVLKPNDAFGAQQPVKRVPRSEFPADAKLAPGEKFSGKAENGMSVVLQIERVVEDRVEIRYIHPLADREIQYRVEVVQVRDPRPPPMPASALELEPELEDK